MERIVRARKFVQGEFYRAKALQELGDDKLAKEALANGKEVQKEVRQSTRVNEVEFVSFNDEEKVVNAALLDKYGNSIYDNNDTLQLVPLSIQLGDMLKIDHESKVGGRS